MFQNTSPFSWSQVMLLSTMFQPSNPFHFIPFLLLSVFLSAWTLLWAARCFIVTVQGSTAGLDRVEWPDEPMFDWVGEAVGLVLSGMLLVIPVGLASRSMAGEFLPGQPGLRFLILFGPTMWLLFPTAVLASMNHQSAWQILSLRVLGGMLRRPFQTFLFYLLSAIVLLSMAGLAYLGMLTPAWQALPLTAFLGSAGWLIYARLVGRLGWVVDQVSSRQQVLHRNDDRRATRKRRPRFAKRRGVEVTDPWAAPEREEETRHENSYRLMDASDEERPARPASLDPEPEPYSVAAEEVEVGTPVFAQEQSLEDRVVEREIELRTQKSPNPPPAWPFFSGVYSYPFYPASQKAWSWLSMWLLAALGCIRIAWYFSPF